MCKYRLPNCTEQLCSKETRNLLPESKPGFTGQLLVTHLPSASIRNTSWAFLTLLPWTFLKNAQGLLYIDWGHCCFGWIRLRLCIFREDPLAFMSVSVRNAFVLGSFTCLRVCLSFFFERFIYYLFSTTCIQVPSETRGHWSLETGVGCLAWVPGTRPGSPNRVVGASDCQTVSPASIYLFLLWILNTPLSLRTCTVLR